MKKAVMIVCADQGNVSSISNRLKKPFLKLGWQAHTFNYRMWQMHRFGITRAIVNQALISEALSVKPDLLLVFKGESINEGVIKQISNAGITTACWTMDDPFGEHARFNKIRNRNEYDYFFCFDKYYIPKLKEDGQPNSHYLPCAVDPEIHYEQMNWFDRKEKYEVSFVGSHCNKREKFFRELQNYDLSIWGYRWKKVKGALNKRVYPNVFKADKSLTDTNMTCAIFNQSKINMNHHSIQSRQGYNLRTFEIPATKSFQLVEYFEGIEDLFKVGHEIACYKNIEEAKEMIRYYLEHAGLRESIANKGYQRVVKDHTFDNRIKTILEVIK